MNEVLDITNSPDNNCFLGLSVYEVMYNQNFEKAHTIRIYVKNNTKAIISPMIHKAFYITHDGVQLDASPGRSTMFNDSSLIGNILPNLKMATTLSVWNQNTLIHPNDLIIVIFDIETERFALATRMGDNYNIEDRRTNKQ